MKILVTGGAGFIGSAFIRHTLADTAHSVVNIDKLSYAANPEALAGVANNKAYCFERIDICDKGAVKSVFDRHRPDAVVHLAGETHVDRSITDPDSFVASNVVGTQVLLECSREFLQGNSHPDDADRRQGFRFLYVSTDEIYGSREHDEDVDEYAPYSPNSPYAGSKAAATHMVRAYSRTYALPVLITCSSNNFGPWQYPEKLIPVTILNALHGEPIPLYGDGSNRRDWLYVDDHVRALLTVLEHGEPGECYNINGGNEISNLELVKSICSLLDSLKPRINGDSYCALIRFVRDRPGHDLRYGIDGSRIRRQLGWQPKESLGSGLRKTVAWYLQMNR
jgi:dTDP-glucose 4,6-dehydratase